MTYGGGEVADIVAALLQSMTACVEARLRTILGQAGIAHLAVRSREVLIAQGARAHARLRQARGLADHRLQKTPCEVLGKEYCKEIYRNNDQAKNVEGNISK